MTDIHSHILFGIDDGSNSIDESLQLLRGLEEIGFDNIILTPHYIEGTEYACPNSEKIRLFNILDEEKKKNGININLYLGNEIFINDHIGDCIDNGEIYTLNNSKYLLFELPMHNQILNLTDLVYEMKYQGYVPILAHPERYTVFQSNYSLIDELKEEGLLFQSNYASILGYYGKDAQKLIKYMLKKKYVDYLGTDIHHVTKSYVIDNFKKIEKEFNKVAGKDYYNDILNNCDKLLKEPNR